MSRTTRLKKEGIRHIFLLLYLLVHPMLETGHAAELSQLVHDEARGASRSAQPWNGPLCLTVDLPKAGLWWLTLKTSQPSTAPSLIIFGHTGGDPRTMTRFEARVLEVKEAGEHVICSTSSVSLGELEIGLVPFGDPLEIEVDPRLCRPPRFDTTKCTHGDGLSVEIDLDP